MKSSTTITIATASTAVLYATRWLLQVLVVLQLLLSCRGSSTPSSSSSSSAVVVVLALSDPLPFWTRRDVVGSSAILNVVAISSSFSSAATDTQQKRLSPAAAPPDQNNNNNNNNNNNDGIVIVNDNVNDDNKTTAAATIVELPLRFLPNGGCWALRVSISGNGNNGIDDDNNVSNDDFSYYAVLDTGSPFLTGPPIRQALDRTTPSTNNNNNDNNDNSAEISLEQYGESVGDMTWRRARTVTLGPSPPPPPQIFRIDDNDDDIYNNKNNNNNIDPSLKFRRRNDVVLGIPTPTMVQETGGIYVGLMDHDDYRPSVLEQFGIEAFEIQFQRNVLKLFPQQQQQQQQSQTTTTTTTKTDNNLATAAPMIVSSDDPNTLELFDLSPYGPDLHHYGVRLADHHNLELVWETTTTTTTTTTKKNGGRHVETQIIPVHSLKRPVVAVLDTGLTGCIFSDSLYDELLAERKKSTDESSSSLSLLRGLTVTLPCQNTRNGKTNKVSSFSSSSSIRLSSNDKYWRFASFRLPWFDDEARHPHIIALGCTFWTDKSVESLCIDTKHRLAKITINK